ncbi:RraA family protein [Pandoraea sp. ISTKB]|uniref:RraA family protein n=1 Tax=Pandoraea sp. ISTKB TaxID=1586708 RepID=UPI0008467F81|nr:RraA family protein [Pandoraea sp. ISTKB]ODP34768.1 methyltransferase [Pandoraea sp. ISTKB]
MKQESLIWPTGYRINPREAGPSDEFIDAFRAIPVPVAGDCSGRSLGTTGLRPYHRDLTEVLCGRAVTVRVRPGDNLMIHKAMLMAQPGDVIVVDGGADVSQALIGGLMRTTAVSRRLAGFIVDGAIRDVLEWAEPGMPVFARGNTHRGPSKDGPGMINIPVAVGGMVVNPGDLILGDADGLIALSPDGLSDLLSAAQAHLKREAGIRAQNASGHSDVERFDAMLRQRGLRI